MRQKQQYYGKVLELAVAGLNTSQDVADELGLSVKVASSVVADLIAGGILKRTGRTAPNAGAARRGRRLQMFEPATLPADQHREAAE